MLKLKKEKAVFTIVKNESIYLPIWLKYYRRFFDDRDIFVLDHQSTDGSTSNLPVNCELVENKLFQDNSWLLNVTKNFQRKLLKSYEQVLFTNIDQIIVADPNKYSGLDDFINKNKQPTVRCHGREILHMFEDEPKLNLNEPIIKQRKWWYESNGLYSKVMLGSIPIDWTIGWHRATNHNGPISDELCLIHTHRIDYEICKDKHIKMSNLDWYKPDIEDKKWGWHSLIKGDDYYNWFYCIPAARTLDAKESHELFKQYVKKDKEEVYEEAKSLCELIPDSYHKVF